MKRTIVTRVYDAEGRVVSETTDEYELPQPRVAPSMSISMTNFKVCTCMEPQTHPVRFCPRHAYLTNIARSATYRYGVTV